MSDLMSMFNPDILKRVQSRVEAGFLRREEDFLRETFKRNSQGEMISRAKIVEVLQNSGLEFPSEDWEDILHTIDADPLAELNFENFKQLAQIPSKAEQWIISLPLSQLFGDAFSAMVSGSADSLRAISELSDFDIAIICEGIRDGLKRMFREHRSLLQHSYKAMDAKAAETDDDTAAKFQVIKMSCGTVEDYYAGVEGRTGEINSSQFPGIYALKRQAGFPHLEFEKTMESEHCIKNGCNENFTTTNHGITTTPFQEWKHVVDREPCSEMRHRRRIPVIEDLMSLQMVMDAKLTRAEVIALVLYTGPMYQVYNTILRRWPAEAYQVYVEAGNQFSTTVFVLVSAVQKLSRSVALPDGLVLYRGLGGTLDLPDTFFRSDARGCKGYAEWAFMSTTADKAVALRFSGVKEGKPRATVLVIRIGAVDRGACIRELSQYPAEVEYLWLPCSWLQQRGRVYYEVTPDGVVRMIPCDVRANLRGFITDELVGRKKNMHVAAFRYLVDDVRHQLEATAQQGSAEERLARDPFLRFDADGNPCTSPQANPPEAYAAEGRYRGLVLGMMETVHMALSKLHFWLEDPTCGICFLHSKPLRTAHRERIAYLTRTQPPGPGPQAFAASTGQHLDEYDDAGGAADTANPGSLPEQFAGGAGGPSVPQQGSPSAAHAVAAAERRRAAAEVLCRAKGLIESNVDEVNELGETRLMAAAAEGRSAEDLRLLVAAGADVNRPDPLGCTAAHAAATFGHVECVRALAELGADINAESVIGSTPVYAAAANGNAACVRALAAARADVSLAIRNGMAPVYAAAQYGHAECVRALAALRADVNAAEGTGSTPLWKAAESGHAECVRALRECGADPAAAYRGWTPAMIAAHKGHAECVAAMTAGGEPERR